MRMSITSVLDAFDQLASFYLNAKSSMSSSNFKASLGAEYMGLKATIDTANLQRYVILIPKIIIMDFYEI